MENQEWKACIDACLACAVACNHCAASCTQEENVQMMANCIYLDMQCATACFAAAQLMSLGSDFAPKMCALCVEICEACGKECAKHNESHCQECAKLCKACAEACQKMAA